MKFEWDSVKAAANEKKHKVPFDYATRVFLDPYHIIQPDDRYAYGEARCIVAGEIESRLFIVAFTYRLEMIRIISARKGNAREQKHYLHARRKKTSQA